jgi:mgtE-like transporter
VTAMMKTNIAGALSKRRLKTNFFQSIFSLSFDTIGLLTGTLLILYSGILSIDEARWALLLFPGILSVRGAVGGLFSGHLGTGLHLGTVKATIRKNTQEFQTIISVIITLAFISGLSVGTGTWLFGLLLWDASLVDFIYLLIVITATMALSVIFVSPLTMLFSIFSFRRGLDPDVIVYPITSPVSDIINTACYVLSLSLFFLFGSTGRYLILIFDFIFISFVSYILIKNIKKIKFIETIKEFLLTLMFVTIIVNITGSLLNRIRGTDIFSVYPAIIATIGGVGSIIGSTATTKLALGLIKPSFSSLKEHLNEIFGAWFASILMFIIYAILSTFINEPKKIVEIFLFTSQLLMTNFFAVVIMIFVAYAIAIYTFRRGWNPDNFVIPIESSLADTVTTASILLALMIII